MVVADLSAKLSLDASGLSAGVNQATRVTDQLAATVTRASQVIDAMGATMERTGAAARTMADGVYGVTQRVEKFSLDASGLSAGASSTAASMALSGVAAKTMADGVYSVSQRVGPATLGINELTQGLGRLPGPLGQVQTQLGAFGSGIGSLLTGPVGITALSAALSVGLAAAVGSMVQYVANAGDHLHDLSIRTGASVESLQALGLAASKSGGSLDEVSQSFRFMSRNLEAATRGSQQQAEAFRALGVDVQRLRALSPEAQFAELAKAIMAVPDPISRASAAMEIFGRAGTSLLPTLKEVADSGLGGVIQRAKDLGFVMSGETARAADQFHDLLIDLKAALAGVTLQIGASLLPMAVDLAARLMAAVQVTLDFARALSTLTRDSAQLTGTMRTMIAVADALWTTVGFLVRALVDFAGQLIGLTGLGFVFTALKEQTAALGVSFETTFTKVKTSIESAMQAVTTTGAGGGFQQLFGEQIKFAQEVTKAAQDAAAARAQAETDATGQVLASIEREQTFRLQAIETEKAAKLKQLGDLNTATAAASEQARQIEQTAIDLSVKATLDAVKKKTDAIEGAVTAAIAALERLKGKTQDDFSDRLKAGSASPFGTGLDWSTQTQAIDNSAKGLLTFIERLKQAKTDTEALTLASQSPWFKDQPAKVKELQDAITAIRDELVKAGEAAGVSATTIKNAFSAGLAPALQPVQAAFEQTTAKANAYVDALDRVTTASDAAAAAARRLELPLTKNSLDDSFAAVADAAARAGNYIESTTGVMHGGANAASQYSDNLDAIRNLGRDITAAHLSSAFSDEAIALLQASSGAGAYATSLDQVANSATHAGQALQFLADSRGRADAQGNPVLNDVNQGTNNTLGSGQPGGHFWLGIGADQFAQNQAAVEREREWQASHPITHAGASNPAWAWASAGGTLSSGIETPVSAPMPHAAVPVGGSGPTGAMAGPGASMSSAAGATVIINNPTVDNERRLNDLSAQIKRILDDMARRARGG